LPLPSGTAAASADWTTGWTEQRSIRLDILIAMANRYAATPLVLDDPALGGRTLSGRFRISEPEELAHRIATLFDLDILRRDDRIYLRPRKFSKLD
jgi:transmembrane sensor